MNNNRPAISVIVTIHNAEKYIQECIESVRNQTFRKIEILCMDGGSKDDSPKILKKYAERDNRIRIINDPNTSYGHKVNRGIQEAKGEYISVLESDDMYEPFMLEKLYMAAEQYHTDFVNADYTCFFDINGQRFRQIVHMYKKENYNRLMDYVEHPEHFGIISRYWTGLFRKSFLEKENIRMNESPGASYQDMSFRFLTSILAKRAYHLDTPVYMYRIDNPDSSMYDVKKTVVIAEEHEFLRNELIKRNVTSHYIWHNMLQWKYTDFRGNMLHLRGKHRAELFQRYLEELHRDRKLLIKYSDLGYSRWVSEMIWEEPGTIEKLIETDAVKDKEEKQQLYQFLRRMTDLDESKRIVIFGCGKRGDTILSLLEFMRNRIECLTDNSELLWGTRKDNLIILSPLDTVRRYPNAFYIVANKLHAQDILQQLYSMGICDDMVCVY